MNKKDIYLIIASLVGLAIIAYCIGYSHGIDAANLFYADKICRETISNTNLGFLNISII